MFLLSFLLQIILDHTFNMKLDKFAKNSIINKKQKTVKNNSNLVQLFVHAIN